jgi:hypothetical protein
MIYCQAIGPNISADVCKILRGTHHAVITKVKPLPPPTPAPTEDTGRTAYRRGACESTVQDSLDRKRAHELKDLAEIDAAAGQWLAEHGADTQVDRWNLTREEL